MTAIHAFGLVPRDPAVFRDGRPFGQRRGDRARTLPFPYPRTVAGTLRTRIGRARAIEWDRDEAAIRSLLDLQVDGPLLGVRDGAEGGISLHGPCPRNALLTGALHRLVPDVARDPGEGCDLPEGLAPLCPPDVEKPRRLAPFWPLPTLARWMLGLPVEAAAVDAKNAPSPHEDTRPHVSIEPHLGTAARGLLFQTTGLGFQPGGGRRRDPDSGARSSTPELSLQIRLRGDADPHQVHGVHPLGGESRLAYWEEGGSWPVWGQAPELKECVEVASRAASGRVSLLLLTPALFREGGWIPDSLAKRDGAIRGALSFAPEVVLRLAGAAVGRWEAISGWDYQRRKPKPAERLVPAGSVYFFELEDPSRTATWLESAWLANVCDRSPGGPGRDGFGMCMGGLWEPPMKETTR